MVSCTPVSLLSPNRGGATTLQDLKRGGNAQTIDKLVAWAKILLRGDEYAPPVALLHGPHGCGKSECVRMLGRTGKWDVWHNDTPAILREPREAGAVWSAEARRAFAAGKPPKLIVVEDLDACTTGSQSETIQALCEAVDEYLASPPIHAAIIITVGGSGTEALCSRIATRLTPNIIELFDLNNRPLTALLHAGRKAAPCAPISSLNALAACGASDIRWVALNAMSANVALRARLGHANQSHNDDEMEADVDIQPCLASRQQQQQNASPLDFIAKMTNIASNASDIRGVCSTGAQLRSWLQIYTAAALAQRAAMGWGATESHPAPSNGRKRRHGTDMHDYPLPSTARTAEAHKKNITCHTEMRLCGAGTADSSSSCTNRALVLIASIWRIHPDDRERQRRALSTLVPACAALLKRRRDPKRREKMETKQEAVNRVMDTVLTVGWPHNAKTVAVRRVLLSDLLAAC